MDFQSLYFYQKLWIKILHCLILIPLSSLEKKQKQLLLTPLQQNTPFQD